MKKVTVVFTEEDMKNITLLLNRCQLQGGEVPAFVNIINALNSAKPVEVDAPVEVKQ